MDATSANKPSELVQAVEHAVLDFWTAHGVCPYCGADPPAHDIKCIGMAALAAAKKADALILTQALALEAAREAKQERDLVAQLLGARQGESLLERVERNRAVLAEVLDSLKELRQPIAERLERPLADLTQAQGRCLAALVLTQALRGGALAVPLSLLQPTQELVGRGLVHLGPPLRFSPAAHALWPQYLPAQSLPPLVEALQNAPQTDAAAQGSGASWPATGRYACRCQERGAHSQGGREEVACSCCDAPVGRPCSHVAEWDLRRGPPPPLACSCLQRSKDTDCTCCLAPLDWLCRHRAPFTEIKGCWSGDILYIHQQAGTPGGLLTSLQLVREDHLHAIHPDSLRRQWIVCAERFLGTAPSLKEAGFERLGAVIRAGAGLALVPPHPLWEPTYA